MITQEELWQRVQRSTPGIRGEALPEMLAFLADQKCPHARLLTGKDPAGPLDQASAEMLEVAIVEHTRQNKISRRIAAQWLRWILAALKIVNTGADSQATLTRLATIPKPSSSPFAPSQTRLCPPVLTWQCSLSSWLQSLPGKSLDSAQWRAGMTLSSVLIGALLDASKVKSMLEQVAGDLPTIGRYRYCEFHQRLENFGDFHCQRWFLDPITDLLLLRRPEQDSSPSSKQLANAIRTLLRTHGTPENQLPTGIRALLKHATAHWQRQAARIDLDIVQRKLQSHAFHERTWNRLFGSNPQQGKPSGTDSEREPDESADSIADFMADLCLLHPWVPVLSQSLIVPPKTSPRSVDVLQALATAGLTPSAVHQIYVDWVADMLAGHNASHDRLAVSTIKRLSDAVIPHLLSRLGDINPVSLTPEDVVELYEGIVAGTVGSERTNRAKGLREFHAFLVRVHKRPSLKSIRDTLGEDAGLEPVDANPISVEEFNEARTYLERRIQQGGDRELHQIAKLSMTLAFRTGMRRWEIFGLRLKDISSIRDLELLVRPHEERRLKSDASTRIIPARLLLNLKERNELQAWLTRRFKDADISDDKSWVFDVPGANGSWTRLSGERTADRIIHALSHATGHPAKIHQLRHSFATWLYLGLRTPEYPEVLPLFDHLPQTQAYIKRGTRFRQLLLNHPGPTSRSHGYVVARLLGHSSPLVSVTSYIHSTEFIHRGLAIRTASQLSAASLRAVANLKPVWGNQLLRHGIPHLVAHVHAQHARRIARAEAAAQAAATGAVNSAKDETTEPAPSLQVTGGKPRGRPKRLAPPDWIALEKLRGLLHVYSSTNEPLDDICKQMAIAPGLGQHVVTEVRNCGQKFGFEPRGIRPLAFPQFARKAAELDWAKELERKLQWAFVLDEKIASRGVLIHLQHYNPSKRDVVFKRREDQDNLKRYLQFLQIMELGEQDLLMLLRKNNDSKFPSWAKKTLNRFGEVKVRCIAPPVPANASSYKDWVGLQLISRHGASWPGTTRAVMFLALVYERCRAAGPANL